jgi:pyruvate,water dikinase
VTVIRTGKYSEGDWGDGAELRAIRDKFSHFRRLLDHNHQALEILGDMEEKSQGKYLFDLNFIRSRLADLRANVSEIIRCLVTLGGDRYQVLQERFTLIDDQIELVFPSNRPIREDAYCRRFDTLSRMNSYSVGSKNAQLGEMISKLGLPVPQGFAVTAWAYKRFIESNDLQNRISERIDSVDIRSFYDLVRVSGEIVDLIKASTVPNDLAEAIIEHARGLTTKAREARFSLRSSAIGEDTLFSFAGQYASYLNVRSDQLVRRYREVLAGKFTPQAIYYFLSHSLSESELAMSVGCVAMVDAAAAGVAYSRDPVNPVDDHVLVNAVWGLGKFHGYSRRDYQPAGVAEAATETIAHQ